MNESGRSRGGESSGAAIPSRSRGRGSADPRSVDRPTRVVAAIVLAAAVIVRVGWLRWMEFSGDEHFFILRAFEALHHGVAYGFPTSAGIRVPPFFVYLVAVPVFFTHDPVWIAGFIAGLNLIGLALLYFFVRELLGARSALFVTMLMAASPWAIMFSRKIWNLDGIFPLVIAMHLALVSNLREYRRWKVLVALALFGAASQIHPSVGLLLIPIVALYTVLRAPIRWSDLWLGLGIVGLLYAPYLGYLLATRFDNLRYVSSLRSKGEVEPAAFFHLLAVHAERPFEISSGANLHELLGMGAVSRFLNLPVARVAEATGRVMLAATAITTIVAIVWSLGRALRSGGGPLNSTERYFAFFAIALLAPILFFADRGAPANQHYYVFVYPIVLVFFVWALERASSWLRAPPWTSLAIVGAICAVQLALMGSFLQFLASDPEIGRGDVPVYYAPKSVSCRSQLQQDFDEVLHGAERQAAADLQLAKRFEASSEVILRLDPLRNEPRVDPHGRIDVEPTSEGLVIRGGSPLDTAALPEFRVPKDRRALLRLDLTSPDEGVLLALFQTTSEPEYSHRRIRDARVHAGRQTVYLDFDAPDLTGRVLLRLEVYRYVIHALEVRAVAR
jgi:hypothetical protein